MPESPIYKRLTALHHGNGQPALRKNIQFSGIRPNRSIVLALLLHVAIVNFPFSEIPVKPYSMIRTIQTVAKDTVGNLSILPSSVAIPYPIRSFLLSIGLCPVARFVNDNSRNLASFLILLVSSIVLTHNTAQLLKSDFVHSLNLLK
jgi:hypothetical protein